MTLFNVWFNTADMSTMLKPSVPKSAGSMEDCVTPRVCLSDSVEGCFQAVSKDDKDFVRGTRFILHTVCVSAFDTKLIHPMELTLSGKVPDAEHNHEYWYTKPISCKTHLCELVSYDYEHVVIWEALKKRDVSDIAFGYAGIDLSMCQSSEDIWNRVSKYLEGYGMYDLSDKFYEDICALPFATGFTFKNVEYNIIK